jgi:hypothetical protein
MARVVVCPATDQGDQIGRIFACWATVYFGQCFENYRSGAKMWTTFFHGTSYVLILGENGLGLILGDFFTNTPGHHATDRHLHSLVNIHWAVFASIFTRESWSTYFDAPSEMFNSVTGMGEIFVIYTRVKVISNVFV